VDCLSQLHKGIQFGTADLILLLEAIMRAVHLTTEFGEVLGE